MDVDPRLLRYFLAVAEDLHFSKASARLGVTQPALSAAIRRLETSFGVELFSRSTRRVHLTRHGAALLPVVLDAVAAHERLALAVDRTRTGTAPLRLATFGVSDTLRTIVGELGAAHPEFIDSLKVLSLNSDEQLQALLRDEIDVGVGRVSALPDGIEAQLVRLDPVSAVVAAGSPLADRPAVPPGRLLVNRPRRPAGQSSWHTFVDRLLEHLPGAVVVDAGDGDLLMADVLLAKARREGLAPLTLGAFSAYTGDLLERPLEGDQPYYAWSLLTRAGNADPRIDAVREVARSVAEARGWLLPDPERGEPWVPEDDLHAGELEGWRATWAAMADAVACAG